jgi:peptidoglycan hydrolase CwlO-like protein
MKLSNRWGSVTLAAALSLSLFPVRAPADELPKFSDPEVNTFVSDYAAFVTKYIQAYQAAQTGNLSQFAQVKTQVKQLQDQVTKVADKLLSKPDEAQRYEQFITEYTEKMVDATK